MTFGSSMSHSSSKTRMSAIEKLKQTNAAKLELETRKMEERIRSLKEKMMKEKEERDRLGGTRWTSGRPGPLNSINVQKPFSLKKTFSNGTTAKAQRKIKILSDEPIDNYKRKSKPKFVNNNINICGQCENGISVWVCRECSENYCDACFNQFHEKGALKKHTKIRIEKEVVKKSENQSSSPKSTKADNDSLMNSYGEPTNVSSHASSFKIEDASLLNGSYDEEESAASFAQALQEWRKQGQVTKRSPRIPLTSTGTSCGTSNESVNEDAVDKKEIAINFHPSISYGDRLFLKKGREEPSMSLGKITLSNFNFKENKGNGKDENILSCKRIETDKKENHESVDQFLPNYREMIQSMATSTTYQDDKTSSPDSSFKHVLSIREVSPVEDNSGDENEVTCIVEECDGDIKEIENTPTLQHGHLRILEMSPSGHFSERSTTDLDHNIDSSESTRYVSPSISSKPFYLMSSGPVKTKKEPTRGNSAGTTARKQSKTLVNKSKNKKTSQIPVYQAWKPKPSHKELSEFFLAGVEGHNERPKSAENNDDINSSHPTVSNISQSCLSTTWHPHHSYLQTPVEITDIAQSDEVNSVTSSQLSCGSRESDIRSPGDDNSQRALKILDSAENILLNKPNDSYQTSVTSEQKLEHWNDEDEELVKSRTFGVDEFGTSNQDDDDLATLNELAWELASSTGRLTRCEEDILDLDRSEDVDSIEDKECGSGLSTPNTLERSPTFHESLMDDFEEMEKKFMEQEF